MRLEVKERGSSWSGGLRESFPRRLAIFDREAPPADVLASGIPEQRRQEFYVIKQLILQPVKARIARALVRTGPMLRLMMPDRIRTPWEGVVVDMSSPVVDDDTCAHLFFRMYESSERRAIKRYIRPRQAVVELGASLGFLSVLIARAGKPVIQVAVEANPLLIPVLRRTLNLNGHSEIQVHHGAIAYDGKPTASFHAGASSTTGIVAGAGEDTPSVQVRSLRLRDVLEEAGIEGPFTLVSDIEGAEWEMIDAEAPDVFERCSLAILELHDVPREGEKKTRGELAELIKRRWRMHLAESDGKVWVFRR